MNAGDEFSQGASFGDAGTGESVVVDFGGVEDVGFDALPKGFYNVEVDELDFTYSQNGGNPMWSWKLRVIDGEFADRILFYHSVFAGKGLPFTKKALMKAIPDIAGAPFNPEEVANSGALIGRQFRARVDVRPYEGEQRNNVKGLFPPEEGGFAS